MHLFSPLRIGPAHLSNRIVFSTPSSGLATVDGLLNSALVAFYAARAQGGAGAVMIEAGWPLPPLSNSAPHLALYDNQVVAGLSECIEQIHDAGACAIMVVDQPVAADVPLDETMPELMRAWIEAAQRASRAGADGIMLSCADGGPFHRLLSPHSQSGRLEQRIRALLETVEKLHGRFGSRMFIGLRLLAEEFTPNGVTLQDARVIARRTSVAGARLIEVYAPANGAAPMAQFPGWRAPLAAAIRAVVDVPVMVGDLNDDPEFVDSIVADRSADLVLMDEVLLNDPAWPRKARVALLQE